jgi:tripartite-type tricarboxylate transporter receptor subunit TctC
MILRRARHITAAMAWFWIGVLLVGTPDTAAQPYPSKPVRIMVGFAAGDPNDVIARIIGQWLSVKLGQAFVIENRPGAGSNLATEAVVRSPADGYTLTMIAASAAINATLYSNLKFNFIRDIAPVASIIRLPLILAVHPSVPAKTAQELIAYARANPGRLNFASSGNGTGPHMAGEMLKMLAGIDMTHVPYRGAAPALTDLITGQVQVMITGAAAEYVRGGRLRALAVTSTTRSEGPESIPALAEVVPGYEATTWFGIGAPRDTPADVVDKLNRAVNAGLADPSILNQLSAFGGSVLPGTPADFSKLISDETRKWGKVVEFSGAKVN